MRRMSQHDRARWQAAASLHDLGQLTAAWLEGTISSQPGYAPETGPDRETDDLIPVLTRINRAGYVTDSSQPGVADDIGADHAIWSQRAAVQGWLDPPRATTLAETAADTGLIAITHPVLTRRFRRREPGWIDVTRRNSRVVTGFGAQRRRSDVHHCYDACGDDAVEAVLAATQLTLASPDYGPHQPLWDLLDHWAAQQIPVDRHG